MDIVNELLVPDNYGADKLHLFEDVDMTNNYSGNNTLGAGYLGVNLPLGALSVYTGVRYENNKMELISNTRSYEVSHHSTFYKSNDIFPSVNANYKLTPKQQLRLAYGKSINRPEFREVSNSVYYDFELVSPVEGNLE